MMMRTQQRRTPVLDRLLKTRLHPVIVMKIIDLTEKLLLEFDIDKSKDINKNIEKGIEFAKKLHQEFDATTFTFDKSKELGVVEIEDFDALKIDDTKEILDDIDNKLEELRKEVDKVVENWYLDLIREKKIEINDKNLIYKERRNQLTRYADSGNCDPKLSKKENRRIALESQQCDERFEDVT